MNEEQIRYTLRRVRRRTLNALKRPYGNFFGIIVPIAATPDESLLHRLSGEGTIRIEICLLGRKTGGKHYARISAWAPSSKKNVIHGHEREVQYANDSTLVEAVQHLVREVL